MSDIQAQQKVVFQGRIFRINVDRVTYPDGRVVNMEVVRHPGSVVLLPMTAPARIVLVRQYRYAVDKWLWELPAGTLEPHEAPEAAALRECHEEIGKIAQHTESLGTFYPSPGFCDEMMHFFVLTGLRDRRPDEPVAAQDPDELLLVKEFSVAEARQMLRRGEITDMKTALGLTLI